MWRDRQSSIVPIFYTKFQTNVSPKEALYFARKSPLDHECRQSFRNFARYKKSGGKIELGIGSIRAENGGVLIS